MKARVWDTDACFNGRMVESDSTHVMLYATDPNWAAPFVFETTPFDRRVFARVEVRVHLAGRWRTCHRWVDPDMSEQFDEYIKEVAARRAQTKESLAVMLRYVRRAEHEPQVGDWFKLASGNTGIVTARYWACPPLPTVLFDWEERTAAADKCIKARLGISMDLLKDELKATGAKPVEGRDACLLTRARDKALGANAKPGERSERASDTV